MAEDESTTGAGGGRTGEGGAGALRATLTLRGTLEQIGRALAQEGAGLEATLALEGPLDLVEPAIERLGLDRPVAVELRGGVLPEGAWEALPVQLRPTERRIVELDLLGSQRRRIAETLCVAAGTVTVYRRTIRARFALIPPRERPPWLRSWLRRFPGHDGDAAP